MATKNVTKESTNNRLTEDLNIPSGRTVTFESGAGLALPLNSTQTLQGYNLVIEGDSLSTDTSPTVGAGNTWPAQFALLPVFVGSTYFNYALNGRTLAVIVANYATEGFTKRPAATGVPAIMAAQSGGNDISSDMSAYWTLLQSHWATLRSDGFLVIAFTIMPQIGGNENIVERTRINNLIRANQNQYDFLIDWAAMLANAADTTYFSDGRHPTTLGNKKLAYGLQAVLRKQTSFQEMLGNMASQSSSLVSITGGSAALTTGLSISGTAPSITIETTSGASGPTLITKTDALGSGKQVLWAQNGSNGNASITVFDGSIFADVIVGEISSKDLVAPKGHVRADTIGKTLLVKSGSNAKAGTFTLVAGTATVSNTSITANSVIVVTLKTLGGTRAGNPDIVPTASTGFVATGAATDTSVYNYIILEVN